MTLRSLDSAAKPTMTTPKVRAGLDTPDLSNLTMDLPFGDEIDLDSVRMVVDYARTKFNHSQHSESDAWLAPRLHYTLRLSRRQAANPGLWRWLGSVEFAEYVRWRFGDVDPQKLDKAAPIERFFGADYKHALGRLWWTAELCRNADDYTPVAPALLTQDIQNNLLRMSIAHHRPTVQAALAVLAGKGGDAANALAKATNSTATTLVLDVLAPDESLSPEGVELWLAGASSADPVQYLDELPPGPEEHPIPPASIATMTNLLAELLSEAKFRDRGVSKADES